jgi:small-conductance mechanosensitive channel
MNVLLEIPTLHAWRAVPRGWSTVVCTSMILVLCFSSWLLAATSTPGSAASVAIDGQPLFTIHTGLANIDPTARAQAIEKRLARLRESPASVIESLTVEDHEATSYIVTSHEVLFVVTEAEAKAAGRPRQELAREQAEKIREVILTLQSQGMPHEPAHLVGLRDLLLAGVATALLIFVAAVVRFLFPRLYEALDAWRGIRLRAVSFRGLELLSADQLTDALLLLAKGLRLILVLAAIYTYMHYMLGLFPWTRNLERTILHALATPLQQSGVLRANLVSFLVGLFLALIATGVFLAALKILQQLFPRILDAVSTWGSTKLPSFKFQRVELLSAKQITEGLLGLLRAFRFIAIAFLIYFYATSILGFFPWTRNLSVELLGYIVAPIKTIGLAFAAALPDIIAIAIIVVVTRYIVKLIRMFFVGIERGAITFRGFHREWAVPTYKIVRFLVLVFAAVAIFPYIPGSQSEAFKGISVFLGVLVSLGAAGSISNVVAGVVLTYMRPFNVGDRVRIADTVGDITEKTLLVTRVRTIKNVDVTIPNGLVLSSHIINFSSSAMKPPPLILHTSVTIGYDVPWRKVHELLISAAQSTTHMLTDPEPFVLQTSLNDFYVTYEINAYTGHPNKMATIYAELHQHIQDKFNEAGLEIMSPHYTQIRDGNKTTIPDQYLPKHYQAPGLRIDPLGPLFGKTGDSAPK